MTSPHHMYRYMYAKTPIGFDHGRKSFVLLLLLSPPPFAANVPGSGTSASATTLQGTHPSRPTTRSTTFAAIARMDGTALMDGTPFAVRVRTRIDGISGYNSTAAVYLYRQPQPESSGSTKPLGGQSHPCSMYRPVAGWAAAAAGGE